MNKIIAILFTFLPAILIAQTIYNHDLDENKLGELKENIRHLSKEPERWTYDSDREYREAVSKFERGNRTGSDTGIDKAGTGGSDDRATGYESPEAEKEWDSDSSNSNFEMPKLTLGPAGKIILYILLGLILAVLIYFLFISSSFKANGAKYVPLDLDETAPSDIPKTELERLLDEAIQAKDYRKAVRVYYLFILKDLSEKKWIQWEKQKTNMHYLLEMQSKTEAPAFEKVLTYFEFIWYGKREITESQFSSIQPSFLQLLKTLNIK
ncbi:MAG: hypothetical protein AB8B72_12135 [Crocinitomicaceae bacterium]